MNAFTRIAAACLLLVIASPQLCLSQGDTVKYRTSFSLLDDSTRIRFELGSIGIYNGSSWRWLQFDEDEPANFSEAYRSKPFTIGSYSDSIKFFRFASFDDKDYLRPRWVSLDIDQYNNIARSASLDSLIALVDARYVGFNVVPATTTMSSSSKIRFIVKIKSATTHVTMARLDTLTCYLNGNGQLRYYTTPQATSIVRAVSPVPAQSSYYLCVERETDLPSGSNIIADIWHLEAENDAITDEINDFNHQFQTPIPGSGGSIMQSRVLETTPLVYSGLSFFSSTARIGRLSVSNMAGLPVLSTAFNVRAGLNEIGSTHLQGLIPGAYLITVVADNETVFSTKYVTAK